MYCICGESHNIVNIDYTQIICLESSKEIFTINLDGNSMKGYYLIERHFRSK